MGTTWWKGGRLVRPSPAASIALVGLVLALPRPGSASLAVTGPAGLPCEATFETAERALSGPDALRLPVVSLVLACGQELQPRPVLVADACAYTSAGAHLRPEPHGGATRSLPEGARLASCLPAGGLWRFDEGYPATHRLPVALGQGQELPMADEAALSLAHGLLPSAFSASFEPLERAWRSHLGGGAGSAPDPELLPGQPLPGFLRSMAPQPVAETLAGAMYQSSDGTWLGWNGPVTIGSARVADAVCDVVSERDRWHLSGCSLPQGEAALELTLFRIADPEPDAVFGLSGPARGLAARDDEGTALLTARGLAVEVAGAAAQEPAPDLPDVTLARPPLLDGSKLIGLASVGFGLVLGGIVMMLLARRGRRRSAEQPDEEPEQAAPEAPVPPVVEPPPRPEPIRPRPPPPPPPPPPIAPEVRPPPPAPPEPVRPPPQRLPDRRIGGVQVVDHPVVNHLRDPALLGAVLARVGLERGDPIELLPEAGAFQVSFRAGRPEVWCQWVVALYPHDVPAALHDAHAARLERLIAAEVKLWRRAEELVEMQRGQPPEPARRAGLHGALPGVRPRRWSERVRPVRLDDRGRTLVGLTRPHLPWASLADEPRPEGEVADALGRLVAATIQLSGTRDVVPAAELLRDLAAGDLDRSGTLRAHQLLVCEDADRRLLVLPTQWRPLLRQARAAFAWRQP